VFIKHSSETHQKQSSYRNLRQSYASGKN